MRAEREWSQDDLAQRFEVSRQSVNAFETGKFDPSLPLAFRLARLFAMPIEQIFSDDGAQQIVCGKRIFSLRVRITSSTMG